MIIGPGWRFLEFPPALKRSWDISGTAVIRGASHRMTVVSRVISYESVRTRAGTFMAFRLTIDWHGIHPDYTFKNTPRRLVCARREVRGKGGGVLQHMGARLLQLKVVSQFSFQREAPSGPSCY